MCLASCRSPETRPCECRPGFHWRSVAACWLARYQVLCSPPVAPANFAYRNTRPVPLPHHIRSPGEALGLNPIGDRRRLAQADQPS